MKPHRGTIILVFGILGLGVCQVFGIAAWIMGNNDLREMNSGYMDSSGRDLTNARRICGIIATALMLVSFFFGLLLALFVVLNRS